MLVQAAVVLVTGLHMPASAMLCRANFITMRPTPFVRMQETSDPPQAKETLRAILLKDISFPIIACKTRNAANAVSVPHLPLACPQTPSTAKLARKHSMQSQLMVVMAWLASSLQRLACASS